MDADPDTNMIAAARHVGQGGPNCEVVLVDTESGEVKRVIEVAEFDIWKLQFYGDDLICQSDEDGSVS